MYGIPELRLPKAIVQHEIDNLTNMGVHIMTNMVIGRVLSIDELMGMGYEAVFVGSGAGLPRFMGIEGEGLVGVYSANEYLTRINLMKAYKDDYETPIMKSKNVAVVGGGNDKQYFKHHKYSHDHPEIVPQPVLCDTESAAFSFFSAQLIKTPFIMFSQLS